MLNPSLAPAHFFRFRPYYVVNVFLNIKPHEGITPLQKRLRAVQKQPETFPLEKPSPQTTSTPQVENSLPDIDQVE